MTISYSLGFVPKWYIADMVGRPLGGGYLATFNSLDQSSINPVFEDPAGQFPWPYVQIINQPVGKTGILFDENGSQGPFYFQFDSAQPSILYYLEVYDSKGNLQWTIEDYSPNTSGGAVVNTAININNLIINSVMYRNIGASANPIGVDYLSLAPGANTSLVQTASNCGPDICFVKNNTSATDVLTFNNFPLGSNALNGDVTPEQYLNYTCSVPGTSETTKCVQYPITKGVQNLSNQPVTVTIWAQGNSGTTTLDLNWLQFFGDGNGATSRGAGPTKLVTTFASFNLISGWNQYTVTTTVPSVTGGGLGSPQAGNDGLFLQVQYPFDATCSIDFCKPSVFLGTVSPDLDYIPYDMIDGQMDTPRTGDYRMSINSVIQGWVPCNDGTIGSANSNASNRNNVDTFPLFSYLWSITAAYTPMYDSSYAPVSRGATALADFLANYQISLTKNLGAVLTGTSISQLPAQAYTSSSGSTTNLTVTNAAAWGTGTPVTLTGTPPTGLSTGTVYYSIYVSHLVMQLATTIDNANANTAIVFTAATGSGNVQPYAFPIGFNSGEMTNTLGIPQMPAHHHVPVAGADIIGVASGSGSIGYHTTSPAGVTSDTGGGLPHNNMQPYINANVFLKL